MLKINKANSLTIEPQKNTTCLANEWNGSRISGITTFKQFFMRSTSASAQCTLLSILQRLQFAKSWTINTKCHRHAAAANRLSFNFWKLSLERCLKMRGSNEFPSGKTKCWVVLVPKISLFVVFAFEKCFSLFYKEFWNKFRFSILYYYKYCYWWSKMTAEELNKRCVVVLSSMVSMKIWTFRNHKQLRKG